MFVLRKCCCYFTLRTGGIIVGWLGVVLYFIALVACFIAVFNVQSILEFIQKITDIDMYAMERLRTVLTVFLTLYIAFLLFAVISASLLTAGAVQGNHYLILPWLITCGINLIFAFIWIIIIMAQGVGFGIFTLVIVALEKGLELHLWLAVLSLFKQLRNEKINCNNTPTLIYKASPATDAHGEPAYTGFA